MIVLEDLGLENLSVYQDDELYCFTSDSVLLAKFATVKANEVVADFCSGSGIVGFYLYGLNKKLIKSLTLFEMQKPLFDLSVKSIEKNRLEDKVFAVNTRLQDLNSDYAGKFSLIVCNPPYMPVNGGEADSKEHIAVCKSEITLKLEELISVASKCLKFGGRLALCHRADRLVEVLCEMRKNNIEPKRLQMIYGSNKKPYLFTVEGTKGGKAGIDILSDLKN